jgi:hypothetical protein
MRSASSASPNAGELVGLDLDQHGITAYPEYEVSGASVGGHLSPDMG